MGTVMLGYAYAGEGFAMFGATEGAAAPLYAGLGLAGPASAGNNAPVGVTSAVKAIAGVPGRVGSRINLSNEGMQHVIARHLSGKVNASQFSLSEAELRSVLSSRAAVNSPVVRSVESADGIRYVREFDAGRIIGTDKFNSNQATSVMTIMTDRFGNLVSTFPGLLK
jgi:filamentous hemagglutinin